MVRVLGAAVKLSHNKLAVAEGFAGSVTTVAGAADAIDERVASLVDGHLALQDSRNVDVDVLAHGADGARVAADFDDRHYGVTDDVALAGGEGVDDVTGGCHQSYAFCRRRGGIHKVQASALGWGFGGLEDVDVSAAATDFLKIAEGFFFDGREPAEDVAFGRLAVGEVGGFVGFNDVVLISLPSAA